MTPTHADLLEALSVEAMTLEAQNRFDTLDKRTVTHEVSPTLKLIVMAYYGERQEFFAMCGTLKYGKAHIVYAAVHPEVLGWVELTKLEALELLTRHALPEAKRSKPERPLVDDDKLWDRPGREIEKARSDSFLLARRATPRPGIGNICGQRPLAGKLGTEPDETRCIEKPWHLGSVPHRNARGDVWGEVQRPVDRVEEAIKPW